MRTIFDYNPSKAELIDIVDLPDATREWYEEIFDEHAFLLHLCFLFHLRKDRTNLKKHVALLSDEMRLDFHRTVNHL
ncbi:hypothetical protein [Arenibacter lacus]|uniref:hypothetical protein n=1 Tax=Arenibacter lacus TaxID=2608629 RepID=UPI00123CF34D|nr:hypothetical protein [Arenibacter lacus]